VDFFRNLRLKMAI